MGREHPRMSRRSVLLTRRAVGRLCLRLLGTTKQELDYLNSWNEYPYILHRNTRKQSATVSYIINDTNIKRNLNRPKSPNWFVLCIMPAVIGVSGLAESHISESKKPIRYSKSIPSGIKTTKGNPNNLYF